MLFFLGAFLDGVPLDTVTSADVGSNGAACCGGIEEGMTGFVSSAGPVM